MARAFPWGKVAGGGILAALVAWLLRRDSAAPKASGACTDAALRARVIEIARAEVGQKLQDKYLADAAPQFVGEKPEWCGIFALWCLHQAGLARDKMWKTGLGFMLTKPRPMPATNAPKPGDVAYYSLPYQHHAIVERVAGDSVHLINGNGSGASVTLSTGPLAKATAYYSIQPHIDAYIAAGCPQ